MKIERVTSNKIKVTLTCDEMETWNIDIEKLSKNAPEAREFFLKIIERAESELSFYAKDSKLLVEAVMKTDYSIIHISKINTSNIQMNSKCKTFNFNSIDDAINVCKQISPKFYGLSTFYKYDESFYIVMHFSDSTDNRCVAILSEFGTEIKNNIVGKLYEYGDVIIKADAVNTLSKL